MIRMCVADTANRPTYINGSCSGRDMAKGIHKINKMILWTFCELMSLKLLNFPRARLNGNRLSLFEMGIPGNYWCIFEHYKKEI